MATPEENTMIADQVLYEKLTSIFRTVFADDGIVLRPETSESDIPGWDSFTNASLIAAIEKEFAVRFRTAELQSLRDVGGFARLIRTRLEPHR